MKASAIPNSNNLFETISAFTESMKDFINTVIKSRISVKDVQKSKEVMTEIINMAADINNLLNEKIKKVNDKPVIALKSVFNNIRDLILIFKEIHYKDLLHAFIMMSWIPPLLWTGLLKILTDLMPLAPLMNAAIVLTGAIKVVFKNIADTIDVISKSVSLKKYIQARLAIRRLSKLIGSKHFGMTTGGIARMLDSLADLSKKDMAVSLDNITILRIIVAEVFNIVKDLALMSLMIPLAIIGAGGLKIVFKVLVSSLRTLEKAEKDVILGGILIGLLVITMTFAVASLLLIGLMVVKGWKLLLAGMLGFAAITGLLILVFMGLGALMSSGIFELGMLALVMISAVLLVFAAAVAIFVLATAALTKLNVPENVLVKVIVPFSALLGYMIAHPWLFVPALYEVTIMLMGIIAVVSLLALISAASLFLVYKLMSSIEDEYAFSQCLVKAVLPFQGLGKYIWDNILIFNPASMMFVAGTVIFMTVISLLMMISTLAMWAVKAITDKWDDDGTLEQVLVKAVIPFKGLGEYMLKNVLVFNPVSLALMTVNVALLLVISLVMMLSTLMLWAVKAITDKWEDEEALENVLVKAVIPFEGLGKYMLKHVLVFNPVSLTLMTAVVGMLTVISLALMLTTLSLTAVMALSEDMSAEKAKAAIEGIMSPFVELGNYMVKGKHALLFNPISLTMMSNTLMRLSVIAGSLGVIAKVIHDIANMRIATEWDEKGNAKNYREMTADDFLNAAKNGTAITQIMAALFGDEKDTVRTSLGDVIVDPIPLSAIMRLGPITAKRIKRLGELTGTIGGMARVLGDIAAMRYPIEFDENGNPKKYERMTGKVLQEAAESAVNLTAIIASMFTGGTVSIGGETITVAALDISKLENIKKKSLERVKLALGAVEPLSSIVETIQNLANMSVPAANAKFNPETGRWDNYVKLNGTHIKQMTSNIQLIMSSLIDAMNGLLKDKNGNKIKLPSDKKIQKINSIFGALTTPLNSLSTVFEKNKDLDPIRFDTVIKTMLQTPVNALSELEYDAEQMDIRIKHVNQISGILKKMSEVKNAAEVEKMAEAHVKFLKQVNATKFENLRYANSLMANMHKITKDLQGNFDKLADTLNEDIIEQLKEVAKLLDEINNKNIKVGVNPSNNNTNNNQTNLGSLTKTTENKKDPVEALQEALARMKWTLTTPSSPNGSVTIQLVQK